MRRGVVRALHRRTFAVGLIAGIAAAACERAPDSDSPPIADAPPPVQVTPQEPSEPLYPPEVEPGFALAVEKRAPWRYALRGWTDRAETVRLEVEDGHNILYGPTELTVRDQHFQTEFVIQQTDRDHVFIYATDGEGNRLAVVPVDTARAVTTVGPAERVRSGPRDEPSP